MTRMCVLLSGGIDPVSGRPSPPASERAAIALTHMLRGSATGLHAGRADPALRMAAGHGLGQITVIDPGNDSLAALTNALEGEGTDLVLTGRQASGGRDRGMMPYLLAERLGWPIVADVIALGCIADGGLNVTLGLPQGATRPAWIRLPAIVIAHDDVPLTPYVHDRARRAHISGTAALVDVQAVAENGSVRAYRARPRLIGATARTGKGTLLIDPAPEEAGRALLGHLRALGMIAKPEQEDKTP